MSKKFVALLLSLLLLLTAALPAFTEEEAAETSDTVGTAIVTPVESDPEPEEEAAEEPAETSSAPAAMPVTPKEDMPKPAADVKAEAVVVNTEGLVMYDVPSLTGTELTRLEPAAVVTLLILGQTWSKVQSGEFTGYVLSRDLNFGFGTTQPGLAIAIAPNGKLTLRAEMTTKSKALRTVKSGQMVLLLAKGEVFSLVRFLDKEGYILTQHLKEVAVSQETGEYTPVISIDSKREANVRLRAEPDKKATVYTTVKSGNSLVVLDMQDGWARVEYEGFHGYMMSDYLKNSPD